MHVGRSYRVVEFAIWSRRSVLYMLALSVVAVGLFLLPPTAGFALPWQVVVMLGTSVSLVAGFKNAQVLARAGEALQAFAQLMAISRLWAALCRDFCDPEIARVLIHRQLAWLTALRFGLRRPKPWESMSRRANVEFRRRYQILEDTTTLGSEFDRLTPEAGKLTPGLRPELDLLARQTSAICVLLKNGTIPTQVYSEMMKLIRDCQDVQSIAIASRTIPIPANMPSSAQCW